MESVLDFQADGIASSFSWATLGSNVTLLQSGIASLTALSMCLRVLIPYFRGDHTLFTMSVDTNILYISAVIWKEGIILYTNGEGRIIELVLVPGYWNNLCFQIDFNKSFSVVSLNGHTFISHVNVTSDYGSPTAPATLVFGQFKDPETGEFEAQSSFRGKLTHFSLWTRLLSDEEVKNFSQCVKFDENALIRWDKETANLTVNGTANIYKVPINETCRSRGKFRTLLSPPLNLPVAESICKLLKGELIVKGDVKEDTFEESENRLLALNEQRVVRKLNVNGPLHTSVNYERDKWTQINQMINKDKEQMNNYRTRDHLKLNKTEQYSESLRRKPLRTTESIEPVGEDIEEEPVESELDYSAICEFEEAPVLRGMGYCPDLMDLLDENYILQSHVGERPLFQGFTGKSITYARGIWIAQSPLSPSIELWYQKPLRERFTSPMGRHLWLLLLTIDEEIFDQEVTLPCDTEEIFLNLTPCFPGTFTCSDGQCLPHSVRCDRKADCEDNSDEEFCSKVYVPKSRRSDLPPPPLDGNNVTRISMKISVLDTDIGFNSMKMSCELILTWMDPTITIYNLNGDPLANTVDKETFYEMWVPTLEFGHNSRKRLSSMNDSEAVILKQDLGEIENYEFSWEAMSYKGSQNSIQIKETLDIDAKCTFNAFLFPFGEQRCSFPFKLLSSSPNVVELSTSGDYGGVTWEKAKQELIFDFSNIEIISTDQQLYSTKELIFKMYPRMGLSMINLFCPSLLLVVIALSSFNFGISHQQLRLGTSLTVLICLMALKIQVGSSLMDKTGVKACDIWLFGCFFVISLINFSHIYIVKDLQAKEESVSIAKVVPVTSVMNGDPEQKPQPSFASLEHRAINLSKKIQIGLIVLVILLVLIYIISFVTMAAIYKF